ncbi:FIG00648844: hypothetical protein [hydrothermal vent metagenome]|uniref:Peptidase M14 domain-containing protein n=1 Tax=hydrothermal vent metagenome TaxID=652676 RepID=A0A3B0TFN6_9ZZZZ
MPLPLTDYSLYKEASVQGRYVVNEQIIEFLSAKSLNNLIKTEGYSVQERPIKSITLGTGPSKVLMWSQMHGNESTTTKGVLDLLNFLGSETHLAKNILKTCTLKIIPMLNPDGAVKYTRVNANEIDLNRDAQDQSQPESRALRAVFKSFKPDFCFNLHDQRTIFGVGKNPKPATVSFLAPAHDEVRGISKSRAVSMKLIVAMNQVLQNLIPEQVGRYDDAFNANCVGDTFQMLNVPTILFEAGHYQNDYQREKTRMYTFYALITALDCISKDEMDNYSQQGYFDIPENKKPFFDILIKNVPINGSSGSEDVGLLYTEVLKDNSVIFEPKIDKRGNLTKFLGHKTYDCSNESDVKQMKDLGIWSLLKNSR